MAVFTTRYGQAIVAVLGNYPPGSRNLVIALEAVVKTAMSKAAETSQDELAVTTCQGLHPGVGKGLVCRRCYDALEQSKTNLEDDTPGPVDAEEAASRSAIEDQVRMLLGQDKDE
jgi:hypothetical protein